MIVLLVHGTKLPFLEGKVVSNKEVGAAAGCVVAHTGAWCCCCCTTAAGGTAVHRCHALSCLCCPAEGVPCK